MKKKIAASLTVLTMLNMFVVPTKVGAETKTTEADVKVNVDPNGSLNFNNATPALGFGNIDLMNHPNDDPTISSTFQKNDLAVSVLDSRGTGAGWNLAIRYSDADGNEITDDKAWTDDDSGSHLKGAQLELVPENTIVTHDGSRNIGTNQPELHGSSLIVSGSDSDFWTAEIGAGLGEWTGTLSSTEDNQSVTLSVPSTTNLKGNYKANLLWTLTDAPK